MARSPAPLPVIRAACLTLEQAVRMTRAASDAAIATAKPTGAAARTWPAWWHYHERLVRWQAGAGSAGAGAAGSGAVGGRTIDLEDALVFDALRSQPRVVRLTPAADGTRPTLTVYPKSAHALFELHGRNLLLAHYNQFVETFAASDAPDAIDAVQRALREIDYQHRVCAWVLTTEGPAQPFADDADAPEPPPAISALSPIELHVVAQAGADVNARRLDALDALLAADPSDDSVRSRRPSWSAFFASIAPEPGAATRLMRDIDLANVMVTLRLGNDVKLAAQQDAHAAADARRDAA